MENIIKRSYDQDWSDWQWQLRNRITTVEQLSRFIKLNEREKKSIEACLKKFRMAITPYYAGLMHPTNPMDPIRLQCVPQPEELLASCGDMHDPLHEDADSPAPGLTHRYPDRVLLLVTDRCSMYCRHCTRRRLTGQKDNAMTAANLDQAINYIRKNSQVRDVVISGGDPLTLPDHVLEYLLSRLHAIPHVEIIRIGTRTPVVMPQRITPELCALLEKYHPIWINTHFNHPREITGDAADACARLARAGIPLGNQSVLLKGVNDNPATMKKLVQALLRIRVRPYYIYQCDLSEGIGHFRTPVSTGIEIIENLRGHTSGLAVPTFVVDAPGGGGKIPLMPNYLVSQGPGKTVLRNFEGNIYVYTEPESGRISYQSTSLGIAGLMRGKRIDPEPASAAVD